MKYSIEVEHYNDGESDGIITIHIENGLDIKWVLSDVGVYPSGDWERLLNYMQDKNGRQRPVSVRGGGGNSGWDLCTGDDEVLFLSFDISGSGGDSSIKITFSFQEMMPIIRDIIPIIKNME